MTSSVMYDITIAQIEPNIIEEIREISKENKENIIKQNKAENILPKWKNICLLITKIAISFFLARLYIIELYGINKNGKDMAPILCIEKIINTDLKKVLTVNDKAWSIEPILIKCDLLNTSVNLPTKILNIASKKFVIEYKAPKELIWIDIKNKKIGQKIKADSWRAPSEKKHKLILGLSKFRMLEIL